MPEKEKKRQTRTERRKSTKITNCCSGHPIKAVSDVISMSFRPVFKHYFTLLGDARQVLQVSQLIDASSRGESFLVKPEELGEMNRRTFDASTVSYSAQPLV